MEKRRLEEFNRRFATKLLGLKKKNLDSKHSIDQRLALIAKAIQEITKEIIPNAKPSIFAN